ncbi:MAG: hypothetical protein QF393_06735 [Rhodospirillales bacterium]|jgi:hypothetical protein|nr:hypothetical protein [Rhodospirillaceae bacterium]MDP6427695.1 hypothetical protein [Rhodospirillales bacterium]MDP6645465.1 hypothetical protein [Rhodospirillales bacterium]|tara:strand:- start:2871 stop:3359 length:489 start_codon:yes stop_codon:yes gene_type:complete
MRIDDRRRNRTVNWSIALVLGLLVSAGAMIFAPSASFAKDRVQLQVFMVKAQPAKGRRSRQVPITVYIDTDSPKHSRYVCAIAPRIINKVFSRLRKSKLKLDQGGSLDMAEITADLEPIVRKIVKRDIVRGVEARQRMPKVAAAGARLFARTGCIGVVDEDE